MKLFLHFYKLSEKEQGNYLMGLIQLSHIQRRRHGQHEDPRESRRQATVYYQVSNAENVLIQVCKKTFLDIFSISGKKVQNIVNQKKAGNIGHVDGRLAYVKKFKYNLDDRKSVQDHINSLPRDESHYGRGKSSKQYLSPELNISRLYMAYKDKYTDTKISCKYYRKVFKEDFPNFSFHPPRTDTCKECDSLTCLIKAKNAESRTVETKLALHHTKYKAALGAMSQDIKGCVEPLSDYSVLSIDMQQVMFVPALTHSDMFYKRQLSCYNFACHLSDFNKAYMCMWHEGIGGRGGDEVTSCLLHLLNKAEIVYKRKLIIWSDNCAAQNKNRMMIFLLLFLVAQGIFDEVTQKFLMSGHSFLSCDRDFAVIEKRKRRSKPIIPEDLHGVVRSAKHMNPFQVVDMESEGAFFDFHEAADNIINTSALKISKATAIRVNKSNLSCVQIKTTYRNLDDWVTVRVLKKGKTEEDLRRTMLTAKEKKHPISNEKLKNLEEMIPFLEEERHKKFYRELLNNNGT